jgi:hypothetical protein
MANQELQFYPSREISVGMLATHNRSIVLFAITMNSLFIMAGGDVPSSVALCMMKVKRWWISITFSYSLGKSAFQVFLGFNGSSHSKIAMNMYQICHNQCSPMAVNQDNIQRVDELI